MSSIEERLVRDIAAVTEGVVVTEQHLREARSNLEEHIEIGQQRQRRRGFVLAAAAAVVVPIIGLLAFQTIDDDAASLAPSDTPTQQSDPYDAFLRGSAPSVDVLTGVWRQDNGFMLLWFKADGTVQFNDEGGLFLSPSTTATYELDGENLLITTTSDGADGRTCSGTELALRASVPESGKVNVVNPGTSGSCTVMSQGAQWTLEQILPTAMYADFRAGNETFRPTTAPRRVHGDWVSVGAEFMLELTPAGRYAVLGGSGDLLDVGQWTVTDEQLELTSGEESPTCAPGDRLVLSQLKDASSPSSTAFFRGSIAANTCGGAWAKTAWWLLPHAERVG